MTTPSRRDGEPPSGEPADTATPGPEVEPVVETRIALPLGVRAVAEARHFVLARLADGDVDPDVANAVTLVVSELVTNAILYGHGASTLVLRREPGTIRVEVADRSTAMPLARVTHDESEIGRGLHIIEACAVDWGVRPLESGKVVWATLAAGSLPPVARDLLGTRG